jgi:fucokinase
LINGIKLITTQPGWDQKISVEKLQLHPAIMRELQSRFALIYTGQRRLARNLLRKVVGNYIGNRPESVQALERMRPLTVLMKYELERGNIDAFAKLLNQHWQLSLQLDPSATNTCIDQIFLACEDLIDGKFICGAGGGGFLQVILKKGVTHAQLHERLTGVFQDSGVDVWETEFV